MFTQLSQIMDVIDKTPKLIIDKFKNADLSIINITRFHTFIQYHQYLGIYRGNKTEFTDELDAFIKLWFAELIEVEEWYNYYQPEMADDMFNLWFLKDSINFNVKRWDVKSAENFVNDSILYKTRLAILGNETYKKTHNQEIRRGYPGVYKKNFQIIDAKNFSMRIDGVINAQEIKYDNSYGGYHTMLIETNNEYILFCE